MLVARWRFITTTAKSHRINLAIKIKIQELQFLFNWMFRYVKYTYLIYFCSKEFVIFVFHSSHFFNHCIWQHYSASFSLPPTKRLYLLPFYLRKFYYIVSCVHQNAQYFATRVRVLCCTMNVAALKVSQIKNIACSPHLEPSTPDAGLHSHVI